MKRDPHTPIRFPMTKRLASPSPENKEKLVRDLESQVEDLKKTVQELRIALDRVTKDKGQSYRKAVCAKCRYVGLDYGFDGEEWDLGLMGEEWREALMCKYWGLGRLEDRGSSDYEDTSGKSKKNLHCLISLNPSGIVSSSPST